MATGKPEYHTTPLPFPLADMTSEQEILQMIGTDKESNMFVDAFSSTLEEAGDEGVFSQVQAISMGLREVPHLPNTRLPVYVCLGNNSANMTHAVLSCEKKKISNIYI